MKLHLLTHDTPEPVNIRGEQPTLRLLINHALGFLIIVPPNGPLTHFSATVPELLRTFVLALDRFLEPGIVILIWKFITKPLHPAQFLTSMLKL
jgi:hypothetical protein